MSVECTNLTATNILLPLGAGSDVRLQRSSAKIMELDDGVAGSANLRVVGNVIATQGVSASTLSASSGTSTTTLAVIGNTTMTNNIDAHGLFMVTGSNTSINPTLSLQNVPSIPFAGIGYNMIWNGSAYVKPLVAKSGYQIVSQYQGVANVSDDTLFIRHYSTANVLSELIRFYRTNPVKFETGLDSALLTRDSSALTISTTTTGNINISSASGITLTPNTTISGSLYVTNTANVSTIFGRGAGIIEGPLILGSGLGGGHRTTIRGRSGNANVYVDTGLGGLKFDSIACNMRFNGISYDLDDTAKSGLQLAFSREGASPYEDTFIMRSWNSSVMYTHLYYKGGNNPVVTPQGIDSTYYVEGITRSTDFYTTVVNVDVAVSTSGSWEAGATEDNTQRNGTIARIIRQGLMCSMLVIGTGAYNTGLAVAVTEMFLEYNALPNQTLATAASYPILPTWARPSNSQSTAGIRLNGAGIPESTVIKVLSNGVIYFATTKGGTGGVSFPFFQTMSFYWTLG